MDSIEEVYLKRIDILEKQLAKKIEELRIEREKTKECSEESARYIYALVEKLGGRAEVRFSELSDQKGVIKCRVVDDREVITFWIGGKVYGSKLRKRTLGTDLTGVRETTGGLNNGK